MSLPPPSVVDVSWGLWEAPESTRVPADQQQRHYSIVNHVTFAWDGAFREKTVSRGKSEVDTRRHTTGENFVALSRVGGSICPLREVREDESNMGHYPEAAIPHAIDSQHTARTVTRAQSSSSRFRASNGGVPKLDRENNISASLRWRRTKGSQPETLQLCSPYARRSAATPPREFATSTSLSSRQARGAWVVCRVCKQARGEDRRGRPEALTGVRGAMV